MKIYFWILLMTFALNIEACKKTSSPVVAKASNHLPEVAKIKGSEIVELAKKSKASKVFVNLWASWCYPCREEFPSLVSFYKKHKDADVDFLFVSMDSESQLEEVHEFLSSEGVDFKTYIKDGDDGSFIRDFDSSWRGLLPTTYLFDNKGNKLKRFDRSLSSSDLEKILEQAPHL